MYNTQYIPRAPLRRKLTLGECRLARYLHEQWKDQGKLEGLPDGVPPVKTDIIPGTMPHDEWKRSVLNYQYVGKLYSTHANQNNNLGSKSCGNS